MSESVSFSQFSKMYISSWEHKEAEVHKDDNGNPEEGDLVPRNAFESKFHYIMRCRNDVEDTDHTLCKSIRCKKLPEYIKLKYTFP